MKKSEWLFRWLGYYWLSLFFYDFPAWQQFAPVASSLLTTPLREDILEADLAQEYDELFKGVNANIYIPLWASACRENGDLLLDEVTLEVIAAYREWGYSSVEMDGNPPDYIGQLFRFLAYLHAGALHQSVDLQRIEEARETFCTSYVLDTAAKVIDGVKTHSATPLFCVVAEFISAFLKGNVPCRWDEAQQLAAKELLQDTVFYNTAQSGFADSLPLREAKTIRTAGRNNCGGKCVITVTEREGCVLGIQSDTGEDHVQLRACVRGRGYRKTYCNGKRLRYPMKRIGERGEGRFQRISWQEAADIAAKQWIRIRDAYGAGSRYVNYATGVTGVISPSNLAKRLLNVDGGYLEWYNSYSTACTGYTTPYIYGDVYSGNSLEDILNTKLLILWGHNPVETIFGSERNYYLSKAKEKGVRIIVIDPRQSDTALTLADEWIGIKPSTDSALADAMAYVMVNEELHDQQFLDRYCVGFDENHMPEGIPPGHSYTAYLLGQFDGVPKTPQWAQEITGVPADTITGLAREYATTRPACLMPGYGMQRTGNGEQATRSLALLACMTGNVGIKGGGAAGMGMIRNHKYPQYPILENPFPGKISCFLWTKAIEQGTSMTKHTDGLEGIECLESNIKLLFNLGGNVLINQHSDINNTIRILKDTNKCEFIICSDVFMTPSAKFADLLLPATSFLEGENIGSPWDDFGSYLLYNNQAIPALFGCRFEYDFLRDVAQRLGHLEKWEDGHDGVGGWLKDLYNEVRNEESELPDYDDFKRQGGHFYKNNVYQIAYEKEIKEPDQYPFATPSGKIEIFSEQIYGMEPRPIPAIPCYVACPEGPQDALAGKYPLQLVGWHTKRRCHSIHDGNEWLEEVEPQRVWMHPEDAHTRGISDGDTAIIFNNRGSVRMPVRITPRIIRGVIAIAQGAWYTPDQSGVDTRGAINVLTSTQPTPFAKGNPQHTNLVEVAKPKSTMK